MNPNDKINNLERQIAELRSIVMKGNYSGIKEESKNVYFKGRMLPPIFSAAPQKCTKGEVCSVGGTLKICSATDTWSDVGSSTPAGNDTEIQFNNAGAFGANSNFYYDQAAEGGFSVTAPTAGFITMNAGAGGVATGGGSVTISAGSATAGNNSGGGLTLSAGDASGSGLGGNINIVAADSSSGDNGSIYLRVSGASTDPLKGAIVFRGESSESFRHLFYAQRTTTNATPGTMCNVDLATFLNNLSTVNAAYVEAKITALRTGGTAGTADDMAVYHISQYVKRNSGGGTYSLVGTLVTIASYEDQAGWDAVFTIATNDLVITVTGAADNNITWRCELAIYQ